MASTAYYQQLWDEIPCDGEEQQDQLKLEDDSEFYKIIDNSVDPFDYSDDTESEFGSPYQQGDRDDPESSQGSSDERAFQDHVHIIPQVVAKRVIATIRSCLTFDMECTFSDTLEGDEETYEPSEAGRFNVKFAETVTMVVFSQDAPRPCPVTSSARLPLKSCLKVSENINYASERKKALKQSRIPTREFLDHH